VVLSKFGLTGKGFRNKWILRRDGDDTRTCRIRYFRIYKTSLQEEGFAESRNAGPAFGGSLFRKRRIFCHAISNWKFSEMDAERHFGFGDQFNRLPDRLEDAGSKSLQLEQET
jgi:hypothetical protein